MIQALRRYPSRLQSFNPNAKLFLLATFLTGLAFSFRSLFFNLYVLSLGYGQDFLGLLLAIPSFLTAFVAIPAGVLANRIGYKPAMLGAAVVFALSSLGITFSASRALLVLFSLGIGVGWGVYWVVAAPFMSDNSHREGQTRLFSMQVALVTISRFAGNLVAGPLPELFAGWLDVPMGSSIAYRATLLVGAGFGALAIIPFAFIRSRSTQGGEQAAFTLRLGAESRPLLAKILLPRAAIALGAGFLVPFLNVFFKLKFGISDRFLGMLFATSGIVTGLGILAGPLLAERLGLIRGVVLARFIVIPSVLILGFSPFLAPVVAAFLIREALMSMGYPLYTAFAMNQVPSAQRSTLSGLLILTEYGIWGLVSWISGYVQVLYGFEPIFFITCAFYLIGALLAFAFFSKEKLEAITIAPEPRL